MCVYDAVADKECHSVHPLQQQPLFSLSEYQPARRPNFGVVMQTCESLRDRVESCDESDDDASVHHLMDFYILYILYNILYSYSLLYSLFLFFIIILY